MQPFVLHLQQHEQDGLKHDVPEDLVSLWAAMPQVQVAVSMKTHYHRNPAHRWKINHIADIDALAIAYGYCDAILTDAEARNALINSRELHPFGPYVHRNAQEMADWLDGLPSIPKPETSKSAAHSIALAERTLAGAPRSVVMNRRVPFPWNQDDPGGILPRRPRPAARRVTWPSHMLSHNPRHNHRHRCNLRYGAGGTVLRRRRRRR